MGLNFTRYIDDLLTLNNNRFVIEILHIYPSELELKRRTAFYFSYYYRQRATDVHST